MVAVKMWIGLDLRELNETWNEFSQFVGGEPETLIMEDFVGDADNVTGTTEELTDIEIAAEVVRERPATSHKQ
ncbi:hypothetical protein IscW_ISCW004318 [Ixodes scapularis]|uniref:Uncharacterized protein n=1 Tax=Ixodes scapularis TaxID=6945 RepID=B7PH38_IXOSC|nr:hypothetical protein IscW_ISCW004318 [Ixodes scapularis]|eukprot:XP_002402103.1 hypothetical protein IscW_ISCW004318 [Ixodes scapularis]